MEWNANTPLPFPTKKIYTDIHIFVYVCVALFTSVSIFFFVFCFLACVDRNTTILGSDFFPMKRA